MELKMPRLFSPAEESPYVRYRGIPMRNDHCRTDVSLSSEAARASQSAETSTHGLVLRCLDVHQQVMRISKYAALSVPWRFIGQQHQCHNICARLLAGLERVCCSHFVEVIPCLSWPYVAAKT